MRAVIADITKLKDVEVIVNAANGSGPMGYGVAGAIGRAAGQAVKDEVWNICRTAGGYKEGDCYISSSGDLDKRGIRHIYHAVTMERPGSRATLDTVGKAMQSTLERAVGNGVRSIAFPGLGTGVGALNPKSVASIMVSVARRYSDRIDVTFADVDSDFIGYVRQCLEDSNNDGDLNQRPSVGVQ